MIYLMVIPLAVIAATLAAYRTNRRGVTVFIAAYVVCAAVALGGGFIAQGIDAHFLVGAAFGAAFGAAAFATVARRPSRLGRRRVETIPRTSVQ